MTSRFMGIDMLSDTGKTIAMKHKVQKLIVVFLLGVFAGSALAEVKMEDIEFSSLPGDKVEIRMIFDGSPPSPTGYTIEQPARIALDLMGVVSRLPSKYHPLGSGNARSVTVVEAGDRTRVIVSMTELVGYAARVEGNSLYILVGQELGLSQMAGKIAKILVAYQPLQRHPMKGTCRRLKKLIFVEVKPGKDALLCACRIPVSALMCQVKAERFGSNSLGLRFQRACSADLM